MTVFRQVAKRRGVVIAAAGAGKVKTIVQDVFIGATILWFAWKDIEVLPSSESLTHGAIYQGADEIDGEAGAFVGPEQELRVGSAVLRGEAGAVDHVAAVAG